MNKTRIKELKQEIVRVKSRYKQEKRQVKIEYKAARKAIAQRMALARKEEAKSAEFEPVTPQGRVSYALDSVTLRLCEPFVKKHEDILYRRQNPEGWEADHLVAEIREIVKFYDKRAHAGKELKQRDMEVLLKIHTALTTIIQRCAGRSTADAVDLMDTLTHILPPSVLQPLAQIDEVFNQAQNMMGEMFSRMGIPYPVTPEGASAYAPPPAPDARVIPFQQEETRVGKLIDEILEGNREPQPQGA
jgi:hypothetical protein